MRRGKPVIYVWVGGQGGKAPNCVALNVYHFVLLPFPVVIKKIIIFFIFTSKNEFETDIKSLVSICGGVNLLFMFGLGDKGAKPPTVSPLTSIISFCYLFP